MPCILAFNSKGAISITDVRKMQIIATKRNQNFIGYSRIVFARDVVDQFGVLDNWMFRCHWSKYSFEIRFLQMYNHDFLRKTPPSPPSLPSPSSPTLPSKSSPSFTPAFGPPMLPNHPYTLIYEPIKWHFLMERSASVLNIVNEKIGDNTNKEQFFWLQYLRRIMILIQDILQSLKDIKTADVSDETVRYLSALHEAGANEDNTLQTVMDEYLKNLIKFDVPLGNKLLSAQVCSSLKHMLNAHADIIGKMTSPRLFKLNKFAVNKMVKIADIDSAVHTQIKHLKETMQGYWTKSAEAYDELSHFCENIQHKTVNDIKNNFEYFTKLFTDLRNETKNGTEFSKAVRSIVERINRHISKGTRYMNGLSEELEARLRGDNECSILKHKIKRYCRIQCKRGN